MYIKTQTTCREKEEKHINKLIPIFKRKDIGVVSKKKTKITYRASSQVPIFIKSPTSINDVSS